VTAAALEKLIFRSSKLWYRVQPINFEYLGNDLSVRHIFFNSTDIVTFCGCWRIYTAVPQKRTGFRQKHALSYIHNFWWLDSERSRQTLQWHSKLRFNFILWIIEIANTCAFTQELRWSAQLTRDEHRYSGVITQNEIRNILQDHGAVNTYLIWPRLHTVNAWKYYYNNHNNTSIAASNQQSW
jgi:hypothetical protein